MAKSAKKQRVLASFTVPMKVEIRQPEFEPLKSLAALDVERLSRGNHKIEIGFIKGGCCPHLVRAVIKNGMVTGCEVEPCKEDSRKAPPPELLALLEKARKKIQAGRKWQPIPVRELVTSSARMLDLIVIVGGGCIFICIWGHCIMCCWWPRPHCFIPDIVVGPL
jgi:hypothetical protein